MRKGQKVSEESKKKISEKLKGRRCSIKSEFARGHKSWNTGTIGLMKANKTSFKKGNIPANYMGGMKICKDGIYKIIEGEYKYKNKNKKIKCHKYENLARVRYREHYGDFDKKLIVFHKDGDCFNNQIENLELITRGENLKRNQYRHKKNCVICGKEFLARVKRSKTCGKECNYEYGKLLTKKRQPYYRAVKKLLFDSEKTQPKHLNSINIINK